MQNTGEILWTSAFLNERFTAPVSPLGWSHVGALFEEIALRDPLRFMGYPAAESIPATRLWHGHPYANVAIFQTIYKPFPDAFVPADAVRYFPQGDLKFRQRAPYPSSLFQPRFLFSLARHFTRDAWNVSPFNSRKWNAFVPAYEAALEKNSARLDAASSAPEFLQILDALYALETQLLRIHRWSLTWADVFYKILAQWSGERAPQLIGDVPNVTRRMNEQLVALAHLRAPLNAELLQRIQNHIPLSEAEQATARALAQFLQQHGHRAFSLDLAQPTFGQDPTQLLPLIQNTPSTLVAPTPDAFCQTYDAALKTVRVWQRPLFRPLVAFARTYAQLREDQRYAWQKALALTRRAYLEIGARWTDVGILNEPSAIFYATRAEVQEMARGALDAADFRARVSARHREWDAYTREFHTRGTAATPHFLLGDMPWNDSPDDVSPAQEWRGRGVSPGIARGAARIVHDPRALGRVEQGAILVAPSTDPGWTPVFARLGGLVLERGGVLSHGAVVAREYHLPAVTAVADITRVLNDGDWIEIDGTTGTIRMITPR